MLDSIPDHLLASLAAATAADLDGGIPVTVPAHVRLREDDWNAAFTSHLVVIRNWATNFTFRDLRGTRPLTQTYIDLDLELGNLATRRKARTGRTRVSELLSVTNNVVILGDPGAGKTTSLKRLALELLAANSRSAGTPILLRLRDMRADATLMEGLLELFGASISTDPSMDTATRKAVEWQAFTQLLNKMRVVLLIDGLDEVPPSAREQIVSDIRRLSLAAEHYKFVLTCRTADFLYAVDNVIVFVLEPLSDVQVRTFATLWLGDEDAAEFIEQVHLNPYAGSEVSPLTLAHLCAIFERTGSVPEKPRTIYRKIIRLLLEEWDEQRSIRRPSAYGGFEIDRKEEFLRALAYNLPSHVFSHDELTDVYARLCESFGLPRSDASKVAREIESHSGLIVLTAYERYEFAHKSLHEYLAAEYIIGLPNVTPEILVSRPNETALAVAMSSASTDYFVLVSKLLSRRGPRLDEFTAPFLRRLTIERPSLTAAPELGQAIAALVSSTYFFDSPQRRLPFATDTDVIAAFLRDPAAKKATRSWLGSATISIQDGNTWRVTPNTGSEGMSKSFMLNREFFIAAGAGDLLKRPR